MASGQLSAKNGRHFKVDQFRSRKVFTAQARPRLVAISRVVGQRDGKHARVNDEHARPGARSLRT